MKGVLKVATVVTTVGSMIPGPIGMASSAANAACLYASGDKAGAAMAVAGIALAAVGAGAAVKIGAKVARAGTSTGKGVKALGKTGSLGAMAATKAKKFVTSGNNVLRIGKGRVALGPARTHYDTGRLTSKIPYHLEYSWKNKKFFLEDHRLPKGKSTKFCFGKRCY